MKSDIRNILYVLFVVFGVISIHVHGCLPQVGVPDGRRIFWSIFNRNSDDNNPNESSKKIDKDMEEKSKWTTNDWIIKSNYTMELHNITTKDGYKLQMQRLSLPGHRPVLLLHGLLTSSLGWVALGPSKSLAFLLYDKHYDVWLANTRGSLYGRNHTVYSNSDANFWSFSFHEIGIYDLTATIDHIRNETSFHQVLIITHSQAFNAVLALCSVLPIYNERILFIQALAPITQLQDGAKYSVSDVKMITKFIKSKSKSKQYEVFPPGHLRTKCLKSSANEREECTKLLKTLSGSKQYGKSMEAILYGQLLQGGSLKEVQHLIQIWQSGDFVAYDYGAEGNRGYYNSVEPLNYDLHQMTVPLVLHFGATDAIATPQGVHQIYAHQLDSVIGVYRVSADKFNHFDFFLANQLKTLLNDKLIDIMENYLAGKLKYVIE